MAAREIIYIIDSDDSDVFEKPPTPEAARATAKPKKKKKKKKSSADEDSNNRGVWSEEETEQSDPTPAFPFGSPFVSPTTNTPASPSSKPMFLMPLFELGRSISGVRKPAATDRNSAAYQALPGATRAVPARPLPPPFGNRFVEAKWPANVVHLREQYNPFSLETYDVGRWGVCDCETSCRLTTCHNAMLGVFCLANCCQFAGMCGNGLPVSPKLRLVRNERTRELSVLATDHIDEGEIIAEYLGKLILVPARVEKRDVTTGYRLVMRAIPKKMLRERLCIDAEDYGSIARFMNHSCDPAAEFYEMSNRRKHTVVVTSRRKISPGEEVTVNYGDRLWFLCRCGHPGCCHRDIQDDATAA